MRITHLDKLVLVKIVYEARIKAQANFTTAPAASKMTLNLKMVKK
jgi:hypothetical protein